MRQFGGSWSQSKLDLVEQYAVGYLRVMQNQAWAQLHYVDAFAGRGRQTMKSRADTSPGLQEIDSFFGDESDRAETEAFLMGSALRAIGASESSARAFDRFTLIDAHRASCEELRSAIAQDFPDSAARVDVVCDDANAALRGYIESIDWHRSRALVFLDPYGLEVDWTTIISLAQTEACDVWYLFPLGGVIRMMVNDGEIPAQWQSRLDGLFGTHDWFDEFYSVTSVPTLFDADEERIQKDASTEHVVEYVRARLKTAFPAVSEPGILRNRTGFPLFALIMGVSNPGPQPRASALRIANHLVKGLSTR